MRGYVLLLVHRNRDFSNGAYVVKVGLHSIDGGRPEDGNVVIDSIECATWSAEQKPRDENGNELGPATFLDVLKPLLRKELRRQSNQVEEMLQHLFHVRAGAKVVDGSGKQPVVCGAANVSPAWAFATWEETVAEAAKMGGRIEACQDCKARLG